LVVVDEAYLLARVEHTEPCSGAHADRIGWAMRTESSLKRRAFRDECAPGVLDFLDWRRKSIENNIFHTIGLHPNEHTRVGQRLAAAPNVLVGHEVQGQVEGEHEAKVEAGQKQQVQLHVDICQL
jgi:hypothetical protein